MAKIRFKGNPEKTLETILYIAQKKPGLGHYHMMKLIFLADVVHLNRYGRPITYDTLCAMQYGPVPSLAYSYYQDAKDPKKARSIPFVTELHGKKQVIVETLRSYNDDYFSETDIEVLDFIIERFGNKTFQQLYETTHAMDAYQKAWDARGSLNKNDIDYEDLIRDFEGRDDFIEELKYTCQHMN